MIRAGNLDRRIRFEQTSVAQDAAGEEVPSWITMRIVWAQRVSERGSERFTERQRLADVDAVYRTRFFGDITPRKTLRFVDLHNGRLFDIKAVDELGRREGLEILAAARTE